MKRQTKVLLELDEREYKIFKFILDYCHHRAVVHETPITKHKDFIDELRELVK